MSKTLEVWHHDNNTYTVVSPDHEEDYTVDGYTLAVGRCEVLMEDGRQAVDINENSYFHIDVDEDKSHVTVTVESEPEAIELTFPYRDCYNTLEKVSECGVPEEDMEQFKYLPNVELHIEWDGDTGDVVGVTIDDVRHDLAAT